MCLGEAWCSCILTLSGSVLVSNLDTHFIPRLGRNGVGIKGVNKEKRRRENHYMPRTVVSHSEWRTVQSSPH